MQQRGSLTISAEIKNIQAPKKDFDGKVYGWEFDDAETGNHLAAFAEMPSESEIEAIKLTLTPGGKRAIHAALEGLAQIKPIGRSEVKQSQRIAYLVFDLLDEKISEFVIHELCREYRREKDQVFFPEHGDFFNKAKARMQKYQAVYDALYPPPPPEPKEKPPLTLREKAIAEKKLPWEGYTLQTMPDNVKQELLKFCKTLPNPYTAIIYTETLGIEYSKLLEMEAAGA